MSLRLRRATIVTQRCKGEKNRKCHSPTLTTLTTFFATKPHEGESQRHKENCSQEQVLSLRLRRATIVTQRRKGAKKRKCHSPTLTTLPLFTSDGVFSLSYFSLSYFRTSYFRTSYFRTFLPTPISQSTAPNYEYCLIALIRDKLLSLMLKNVHSITCTYTCSKHIKNFIFFLQKIILLTFTLRWVTLFLQIVLTPICVRTA